MVSVCFITALEIRNSKYVQCNRSLFVCAIVVSLNISDGVMMVQSDISSVDRHAQSRSQQCMYSWDCMQELI